MSSHQIEVTAVQFNHNDTVLYTGTNRGIINVWDIESQKQNNIKIKDILCDQQQIFLINIEFYISQIDFANQNKISFTLKGHSGGINALAVFPYDDQKNLLLSGSFDTSIKVWDLRTKEAIHIFKGHTMHVNTLAGSPDGKIVASGGSDSQVKLWDINQGKCVTTFNMHDASVTCLKFNPVEMALASASADRTVKYYDLDTFQLISQTKLDATPIQQILFNEDGNILFSAAHESLKVWNLDKDGLLLDNVESQWRGIQDIQIADADEMLLGLTSYQQTFCLWACPLKLINMDSENANTVNQRVKTGSLPNIPPSKNFLPQIEPKKSPQDENKYAKIHGTENPQNQRSNSDMHHGNIQNQDYQYGYQGYAQNNHQNFAALPQINNNSILPNLNNPQGYSNNQQGFANNPQTYIRQQSADQFGYFQQQISNQNMLPPTQSPQIINAVIQNPLLNDDQMSNKKSIPEIQEDEQVNQAIINKQFEELNNQSRIYNQILPPKEQIKIGSNLSSQSSKEEIEEDIEVQDNSKKNKPQTKETPRNVITVILLDKQLQFEFQNKQIEQKRQQPLPQNDNLDVSSLTIVDSLAQSFNFNNVSIEQQLQKQVDFIIDVGFQFFYYYQYQFISFNHQRSQKNTKNSSYS